MSTRGRSAPANTTLVKIGGSLCHSSALGRWLDLLAGCGAGRVVIVPGGGPFADAVRAVQRERPLSEAAAHDMALLAMAQFARLLTDLEPRLRPAYGEDDVLQAWRALRVPVWFPVPQRLAQCPEIRASWDVTADSLAAWLAGRLGCKQLVLVKSAPPPRGAIGARALADHAYVDPAFPEYLARAGAKLCILGADERHAFARVLE